MRSKLLGLMFILLLTSACTRAQVAQVLTQHHVKPTPAMVDKIIATQRDAGKNFLVAAKQLHDTPVLACIRAHESDRAGGYLAVSPGGQYHGAYQYLRSTWHNAAVAYGAPQYADTPTEQVPGFWQDLVTWRFHLAVGDGPWGNRC